MKSPIRSNIIATLGAFAMLVPAASAMPAGGPVGGPQTAPFHGAVGDINAPGATAAEVAQSTTVHTSSDAAQRSATEGVIVTRSADRSDAAQRVPGQTSPIQIRHSVPGSVSSAPLDTGADFDPVVFGIGGGIVLLFAAGGAVALRSRRLSYAG